MRYIIDRFEENYAVVELESLGMVNVDKRALPEGAKEGDVIHAEIDREATQQKRAETEALMERVVRRRGK